MGKTPAFGFPVQIRRTLVRRRPLARSIAVHARSFSDATLFCIQLAGEIGRVARFDRNYLNVQTPREKLALRYPFFQKCFAPDPLAEVWTSMPARRENVPRSGLNRLLEFVRLGKELPSSPDDSVWVDDSSATKLGYQNDEDVGGAWRPPSPQIPDEIVPEEPILPEFERLWSWVERCTYLPALLILDPIDALALRYGVEASRLVAAIQADLVDTGLANVVYVFEGLELPSWFHLMDGIFRWEVIPPRSLRRQWLLTIQYLAGCDSQPRRHVLGFEGGLLTSGPSDEELLELLESVGTRAHPRGIPLEITRFLKGPVDEIAEPSG